MQQRMMGGEPAHGHLIKLILGVIYEKAGINGQQHNSPYQQEKQEYIKRFPFYPCCFLFLFFVSSGIFQDSPQPVREQHKK